MARKRSIPTNLFASPDFFELSTNTVRLIFIGLILDADDEGRGCAHPRLLARKLDQQPEDIEQALEELAAHTMLSCYEVAGRRLYWLCHWQTYQTLSKPTPSSYPPPPADPENQHPQQMSRTTTIIAPTPLLANLDEQKAEKSSPASLALPSATRAMAAQVASVLHLPEDSELQAVVQEFAGISTLSVVGEAIEAGAWINDRQRIVRHQPMTPAFFRRWLRRSQGGGETFPSISTRGVGKTRASVVSPAHEQDQYEVYVKALQAQYSDQAALQEVG